MTLKRTDENLQPIFRVEQAFGTRPRVFVVQAGLLSVRMPVNPGVHNHLVVPVMRRELGRRLFELLDQLTIAERN